MRRTLGAVLVMVTMAAALLAMAPAAHARPDKVSICHVGDEGETFVITVSERAIANKLAKGDFMPVAGRCDVGPDNDADGFGALEDCDDTDATVFPGAPEIAGNGVDEDCDGMDAMADRDGDGVLDAVDNCPDTPNPDQSTDYVWDISGGGLACNPDIDGDGIANDDDPCPLGYCECSENPPVLPGVFSPDGDGFYETFVFDLGPYVHWAEITVYNRWGEIVFDDSWSGGSGGPPMWLEWDGTDLNGSELNAGVYIYMVSTDCDSAAVFGNITLLR